MSLLVDCPSCNRKLKIPDELLGQNVKCPTCSATFTATGETFAPPLPRAASRDSDYKDPPPRRRQREDGDYDKEEEARPRRQGGVSRCTYCRSTFPPLMKKKIAPAGWIVFAAVLAIGLGMCLVGICFWPLLVVGFACLPLSVLGILITTEERVCSECGAKRGG